MKKTGKKIPKLKLYLWSLSLYKHPTSAVSINKLKKEGRSKMVEE